MKNNIVAQHNNLINAKYKLSLNEKRILLCIISKINPQEKFEGDLIVKLNIKDIIDVFDCNKENYTYFIELAKGLRKKDFPINRLSDGRLITVGWFSRATVDTKGVLEIKIDETIIPYLIELKEYTKYKLENVVNFKNVHTFRIYELCKQYESLKKRAISIQELKELLQLEDRYSRTIDFRRYVLDVAKTEINEHSDMMIDYDLVKEGRSYTKINFTIKSKKLISIEEVKQEEIQLDLETKIKIDTLKSIIHIELEEKDYISILDVADNDLAKVLSKYYLIKDKKDIKNFTGLLIDAIKEDYSEVAVAREVKPDIKTKFHNLGEERFRKYSSEEFEQIALEKNKKKFDK